MWGASLNLQFRQANRSIIPVEEWQVRGKNKEEFCAWISNHKLHSLFFDGAAKGNPRKAGPGGTVNSTEGTLIHSFAWGLGFNSSIQAEALALYQGLKLLLSLEIKEAIILGDSQVIIKLMVTNTAPRDLRLARQIQRIRSLGKLFQNLKYFHVLRENNKEADREANKATLLSAGANDKGRDRNLGSNTINTSAAMFYCLILNQFVCIFKLGQITEINSIVEPKKSWKRNTSSILQEVGSILNLDNSLCNQNSGN